MKLCPSCQTEKPESEFNRMNKHLQAICKPCHKVACKVYYQANKDKARTRWTSYRESAREKIDQIKAQTGCLFCPEKDECCLDFHHRPGVFKTEHISDLLRRGVRWGVIEAEMAKCVVVCANCHRKLHRGKLTLNGA